jgi:hypothetical protein
VLSRLYSHIKERRERGEEEEDEWMGERERLNHSNFSFYNCPNSIVNIALSWSNYTLKAPSLNITTMGNLD